MYRPRIVALAAGCCFAIVSPIHAATITFTGAVANTCVINISTPGVLAMAAAGTTLSSEEALGTNAILAVIATGTAPQLQFTLPVLGGPAASIAAASTQMAYTSPGGAAQAYTPSASNYTMNRLLDTITVKAKATNSDGFASGTYTISSTVTCQQ